jgi:hypothetical protein
MIELRRQTRDSDHWQIARRYWKLGSDGEFKERVSDIGDDYGVTHGGVLGIARSACTARSAVHRCVECGEQRIYTSRSDFLDAKHREVWVCPDCLQDAPREYTATPDEASRRREGQEAPVPSDLSGQVVEATKTLEVVSTDLREATQQLKKLVQGLTQQRSSISAGGQPEDESQNDEQLVGSSSRTSETSD